MAITVNYAPDAGAYGLAGFMAGRGEFQTGERRFQSQRQLQIAQLLQQERGQIADISAQEAQIELGRGKLDLSRDQLAQQEELTRLELAQQEEMTRLGIDAKTQQQMRQLQASLLSQQNQRIGEERMAVFDFLAGQNNQYQASLLNSRARQQSAYLQNWGGALDDQRQLQAGLIGNQIKQQQIQLEAQERIDFAMDQAEDRRAAIQQALQQRVRGVQSLAARGMLEPYSAEQAIARYRDEAAQLQSGVTWETEFPEGPTPGQVLQRRWRQNVYEHPQYGPMQWDQDKMGFEGVRNTQDQQEQGPAMAEQVAAKRYEQAQKEYQTDLKAYNDYAESQREAFDSAYDRIRTDYEEQAKGQYEGSAFEFPGLSAQDYAKIREMAEQEALSKYPSLPPVPRPTPPWMQQQQAPPPQQPQFQIPPGGIPGYQPVQTAVPASTVSAMDRFQAERDAQQEEQARQRGRQREPQSVNDLRDRGGDVLYTRDFERLPPNVQPVAKTLGALHYEVAGDLGTKEQQVRSDAVQTLLGAYSEYGADIRQWPPAVVRNTVAARSFVKGALADKRIR